MTTQFTGVFRDDPAEQARFLTMVAARHALIGVRRSQLRMLWTTAGDSRPLRVPESPA